MKEYQITIEGTAPLLQHRYQFKDEIEASTKKKSGSIDYSEDWKKALYWNPEAGLYQPASHIEGALIKAASNFQITGKGKRTYAMLFKGTLFVSPEIISYGYIAATPDELIKKGFIQIHKSVVVVNRGRIERLRPMLPIGWKLSFIIQCFDDQLPKEVVREVLDYSGKFVGIGDWRPRFGRFMVTKFK